ncbi:MAG: AraC family transcriptional regulator [Bacteroidota bacterium]
MGEVQSTIINALIVYGGLQAIFIAIVLLKSKNQLLFNKLFSALLIIEGISLLERWLVETDLIHSVPHFLGVCYPFSFMKPPLLLFMALAVTNSQFKLNTKFLYHFIPFGLMLLMNIPFYLLEGTEKLKLVAEFTTKIPTYSSFEFYFYLSFFVYIGIYLFMAIRKLNHYRSLALNNTLVNWYRIILYLYLGFLGLHLLYFISQPLFQTNFALVNQLSLLVMTFIIQSIFFVLINNSTLLNTRIENLDKITERERHLKLIIDEFENEKAHLNDELSLDKFASAIAISSKEVSKTIQQKYNISFQKLVARYRVQEAKKLIENSNSQNLKLIDIAFQSGFSNKVSFYRSFKEMEGLSPSDYVKSLKKV